MQKHLTFSMLLLIFAGSLFAQRQETLFDNDFGLTGFWVSPKYNFSYFDDQTAYVRGTSFGFEFGRTVIIGWSTTKFKDEIAVNAFADDFSLKYSNFMLNITPQSYKVVHPILGFQTGTGRLKFDDGDSEKVYIVQPSAGIEINVFKWFRVGADGGYRFVSNVDSEGLDSSDISGAFVQLNLKFGFSSSDRW